MPKFGINAGTWSALNSLLDRVLDLAPAERLSWIDALDPEYDALQPRLRDLISRGAALRTSQILGAILTFPELQDEQDGPPADFRLRLPGEIAGTPIGTASDVYSLGVVLYELPDGNSAVPP